MQLQTGVNYRMIKNVSELGFTLNQYTKAIADAPFKYVLNLKLQHTHLYRKY